MTSPRYDVSMTPGALTTARNGLDENSVAGIERAVSEALADLERMRESEGATLADEMRNRDRKVFRGLRPGDRKRIDVAAHVDDVSDGRLGLSKRVAKARAECCRIDLRQPLAPVVNRFVRCAALVAHHVGERLAL